MGHVVRAPLAFSLVFTLGVAALARPAYPARQHALTAAAATQRAKRHLTAQAACRLDPDPHAHLAQPLKLHAGEPFELRIPGTFQSAPGAVFQNDAVQVTSTALEEGMLVVRGKVAQDALPQHVTLALVGALCPRVDRMDALELFANTRWKLAFPGGLRVALECGEVAEDRSNCQVTWSDATGATLTERATLSPDGGGSYRVRFHLNERQIALVQAERKRQLEGPGTEIQTAVDQAQERLGRCAELPPGQRNACVRRRTPALARASARYHDAMRKVSLPDGPPLLGCENANLRPTGARVTAEAFECGAAGKHLRHGTGSLERF